MNPNSPATGALPGDRRPAQTNEAQCPHCSTPSVRSFATKDYNRRVTDERFQHFVCPACRIVFIDPIPGDLQRYYGAAYHGLPTREALIEHSHREQFKVEIIRKFMTGGRLLEVGPSIGAFLVAAQRAGFETSAIEFDPAACEYLQQVPGIRALRADAPEDVVGQVPGYDVLAMWHVIEHLGNPWRSLPPLLRKLSRGGIVTVSSPNPDSAQFRIFRGRWFHADAPRHLELIPRSTLDAFMSQHGLSNVFTTYADEATLLNNEFGWAVSLRNLTPGSIPFLQSLAFKLGRLFSPLLSGLDARPGAGSCYTVVYRKP
jgi:2-polyprenyl-3-methyl-5-hydroxy-6-metoxy-1,4-benzoquinol methylase